MWPKMKNNKAKVDPMVLILPNTLALIRIGQSHVEKTVWMLIQQVGSNISFKSCFSGMGRISCIGITAVNKDTLKAFDECKC